MNKPMGRSIDRLNPRCPSIKTTPNHHSPHPTALPQHLHPSAHTSTCEAADASLSSSQSSPPPPHFIAHNNYSPTQTPVQTQFSSTVSVAIVRKSTPSRTTESPLPSERKKKKVAAGKAAAQQQQQQLLLLLRLSPSHNNYLCVDVNHRGQ
jgi:hypothetical protein